MYVAGSVHANVSWGADTRGVDAECAHPEAALGSQHPSAPSMMTL